MAQALNYSIWRLGWESLSYLHQQQDQTVRSTEGLIISPLSITIALGMLAGTAAEEQRTKLCDKLGIPDSSKLADAFAACLSLLQQMSSGLLKVSNSIVAQQDVKIKTSYLEFLKTFAADVHQYPDLSAATPNVNEWISAATHGMVKDMLRPYMLKQIDIAILNALAFKGKWETPFNAEHTQKDHSFHKDSENPTKVDMMFRNGGKILIAKEKEYTVIRLPYQGPPDQATVFFQAYLPTIGDSIPSLFHHLSENQDELIFKLVKLGRLGLPRFKNETLQDMIHMLQTFGYPLNGSWPEACESERLHNSETVLHKAVIELDEEGTKAAAVTVFKARKAIPKERPIDIVFDRPFVYTIIDATGVSYFTGLFNGS